MSKINHIEAVILAGGQSRRMGEDKARLRVGRRSLLGHARALAADLGLA
jgi:molybdopterin-guanine dinucleotide biosynthesis protein A